MGVEFPIDFLISGATSSTKLERSMAGDPVVHFPGRAAADQYFPQLVGEDSVILQLGLIKGFKDIDFKPLSDIDVVCRCFLRTTAYPASYSSILGLLGFLTFFGVPKPGSRSQYMLFRFQEEDIR